MCLPMLSLCMSQPVRDSLIVLKPHPQPQPQPQPQPAAAGLWLWLWLWLSGIVLYLRILDFQTPPPAAPDELSDALSGTLYCN